MLLWAISKRFWWKINFSFFCHFIKQRIEPYFHRLSLLTMCVFLLGRSREMIVYLYSISSTTNSPLLFLPPQSLNTHRHFFSTPLFLFTSQFFRSPGQESWWHFPCPSKFYVFRRWWKEREREKGKGKERWKAMEVELFTFITNWKSEFVTWRNKKCHYLIFFPFFQLCAT